MFFSFILYEGVVNRKGAYSSRIAPFLPSFGYKTFVLLVFCFCFLFCLSVRYTKGNEKKLNTIKTFVLPQKGKSLFKFLLPENQCFMNLTS